MAKLSTRSAGRRRTINTLEEERCKERSEDISKRTDNDAKVYRNTRRRTLEVHKTDNSLDSEETDNEITGTATRKQRNTRSKHITNIEENAQNEVYDQGVPLTKEYSRKTKRVTTSEIEYQEIGVVSILRASRSRSSSVQRDAEAAKQLKDLGLGKDDNVMKTLTIPLLRQELHDIRANGTGDAESDHGNSTAEEQEVLAKVNKGETDEIAEDNTKRRQTRLSIKGYPVAATTKNEIFENTYHDSTDAESDKQITARKQNEVHRKANKGKVDELTVTTNNKRRTRSSFQGHQNSARNTEILENTDEETTDAEVDEQSTAEEQQVLSKKENNEKSEEFSADCKKQRRTRLSLRGKPNVVDKTEVHGNTDQRSIENTDVLGAALVNETPDKKVNKENDDELTFDTSKRRRTRSSLRGFPGATTKTEIFENTGQKTTDSEYEEQSTHEKPDAFSADLKNRRQTRSSLRGKPNAVDKMEVHGDNDIEGTEYTEVQSTEKKVNKEDQDERTVHTRKQRPTRLSLKNNSGATTKTKMFENPYQESTDAETDEEDIANEQEALPKKVVKEKPDEVTTDVEKQIQTRSSLRLRPYTVRKNEMFQSTDKEPTDVERNEHITEEKEILSEKVNNENSDELKNQRSRRSSIKGHAISNGKVEKMFENTDQESTDEYEYESQEECGEVKVNKAVEIEKPNTNTTNDGKCDNVHVEDGELKVSKTDENEKPNRDTSNGSKNDVRGILTTCENLHVESSHEEDSQVKESKPDENERSSTDTSNGSRSDAHNMHATHEIPRVESSYEEDSQVKMNTADENEAKENEQNVPVDGIEENNKCLAVEDQINDTLAMPNTTEIQIDGWNDKGSVAGNEHGAEGTTIDRKEHNTKPGEDASETAVNRNHKDVTDKHADATEHEDVSLSDTAGEEDTSGGKHGNDTDTGDASQSAADDEGQGNPIDDVTQGNHNDKNDDDTVTKHDDVNISEPTRDVDTSGRKHDENATQPAADDVNISDTAGGGDTTDGKEGDDDTGDAIQPAAEDVQPAADDVQPAADDVHTTKTAGDAEATDVRHADNDEATQPETDTAEDQSDDDWDFKPFSQVVNSKYCFRHCKTG